MATKTTRGRPKGSGINDDKIIKKITALMAKDPDLKATTAIKAAGITDASSIRRLRDKLKTKTPATKRAAKKPAAKKATPAQKAKSTTKTKSAKTKATAKKTIATRKAATAAKTKPAKKQPAKKTITTRTASASRAAAKKTTGRKTVQTRKAPSRVAKENAMTASVFENPFEELTKTFAEMASSIPDMSNGQSLPEGFGDLDLENIVSSTVEKQIQLYESALKFSPIASLLRQQALLTDMMLTMLRTQKEISKNINK